MCKLEREREGNQSDRVTTQRNTGGVSVIHERERWGVLLMREHGHVQSLTKAGSPDIYIYTYLYLCICIYIDIHRYVYVHIYIDISICKNAHICISNNIYLYIYLQSAIGHRQVPD